MGRLVQSTRIIERPVSAGTQESVGGRSVARVEVAGDQFAERIVKYIPAEVVTAYVSLENMFDLKSKVISTRESVAAGISNLGTTAPPDVITANVGRISMLVFVLGVICTPLYIWQQGRASNSPWATHAAVATLAFVVWAYAIGGSFFLQSFPGFAALYNGQIAAAGLIIFTLLSGAIKPAEQTMAGPSGRDEPEGERH